MYAELTNRGLFAAISNSKITNEDNPLSKTLAINTSTQNGTLS